MGLSALDRWAPQLDGRLVYQHTVVFAPEISALHFRRLANIARSAKLTESTQHLLACGDAKTRAAVQLLEYLVSHSACEDSIAAVTSQLSRSGAGAAQCLYLAVADDLLVKARDDLRSRIDAAKDELRSFEMNFLSDIVIGGYVIINKKSRPNIAHLSRLGEATAFLDADEITPQVLLERSARALLSCWSELECMEFARAGVSVSNPAAAPDTFGRYVVAEYVRRVTGVRPKTPLSHDVPRTPFCRDAFLAWQPVDDRVTHTFGAKVNHCTSLGDVALLGIQQ